MDLHGPDSLRTWFDGYVAGVQSGDPFIDRPLKFKYDHSLRTQAEIRALAKGLELGEGQQAIAEAIGLLHDVGRFEQFVRYRTYDDTASTDHGVLGAEVLQKAHVLADLPAQERQWIEAGVLYHNRRELPTGLDDQTLFFCELIRDADKLEIFHIVVDNYRQLAADPAHFEFHLDRPDEPSYSRKVVAATIAGRGVDWKDVTTLNDIKIMQLGWVHDINFAVSLQRIVQYQYLDQILALLPPTEDIRHVREAVLRRVRQRLANAGRADSRKKASGRAALDGTKARP